MTLIVTTISDLGILQASDSNLTTVGGAPAGIGRKVFLLPFCRGALSLAGSYSISGVRMDAWMPRVIAAYASSPPRTLEGFARHLRTRLDIEQDRGSTRLLLHVAGYAHDARGSHPEMWFVRNVQSIHPITGEYEGITDQFVISEDFWTRDYPAACATGQAPGGSLAQQYFNGLAAGRISYNALSQTLHAYLQFIWSDRLALGWAFRQPRNISELALFMKLELTMVATLFKVSDYPTPYVGGRPQVKAIRPPSDAVRL